MRTVPANTLIRDDSVYPRDKIVDSNVYQLILALASGATLPPIVVEKSTLRIVDGVHRHEAYKQHCGDAKEVTVIEKEYGSDRELFLDAIRYNASHGAALNESDRRRSLQISARLEIDNDSIAGALSMPTGLVGSLRSSISPASLANIGVRSSPRPVRRPQFSMEGARTTETPCLVAAAHSPLATRGPLEQRMADEASMVMNRLIGLIEDDAVDFSDPALKRLCAKLHLMLEAAFG